MIRQLKELLWLAAPLVLAQLAQNTVSFVDTIMVGRLGNEALAGIALGSTTFHFVAIIFLGIVIGVNPTVSQATGAGDEITSGKAVRQGLWLGLILSIPAIILFWNIAPFLLWIGQPEATVETSSAYLRAISPGMIPYLWIVALRGYLEGKSNTRPIMLILFVGVVVNIFANDALMFGKYGLPKLGLVGTAYASVIVYFLNFLMLIVYLSNAYKDLRPLAGIQRPDGKMMKELIKVGLPIGMSLAFEGSMFTAAAVAMGTLGETELAAHQIALQTASITFMIPLGVALATTVLVGQAIGAKDFGKARLAGQLGMGVCVFVMAITALILWLFPRNVTGLYVDVSEPGNESLVSMAISFLMIAALFQVVDGLQVAANGALRGLKDTAVPMVLTLISYWGVGCVTGAFLCYGTSLRGQGLWYGMTAGLAAAALLLTFRFYSRVTSANPMVNSNTTEKK